jgi:hypothetical protein
LTDKKRDLGQTVSIWDDLQRRGALSRSFLQKTGRDIVQIGRFHYIILKEHRQLFKTLANCGAVW